MELLIEVKNVYGQELAYASNEIAEKFVKLIGKKTFSITDLRQISDLGYTVKVKTPEINI
jgi:DUF1365 family protein